MIVSQSRRLILAGAGALMLGATARSASAAGREQIVNIGFAGGFGVRQQSNLSFGARDGALLAVDDANLRGIVIGGKATRFALMVVDDQSEMNFARIAANSFVAANVSGVIGHVSTDTSIAAAPIYADAGIPMISPTATGRSLTTRGYKNVFQLLGNSEITTSYLTEVSGQVIKARRVAVLDNGTQLGAALADGYIARLRQAGIELAVRESVGGKSSDFSATLLRIKAAKPDLMFFTAIGPQVVALLQACKRVGLDCKLLSTGGGVNLEFPRTGLYPDGSSVLLHGLQVDRRPGYAEFEKSYRRKYDSALTAYAMFSYDAVGMLVEAMRRLDSTDPRKLSAELHKMQYRGMSGPVAFAADGAQVNPPYTLYQASQAQWQGVKSFGG
ncbi:branched-chain amino acid ABC transporter substrate-binding protein [Herbaspirillum sp. LeCh32-8]|uniref:branched-chain amino acid ABC transporter substrate-binding protein n=1 Tax=Herbaspirillum sp. LeCh32-8 TaxID=2821356 RepID=UPI001AE7DD55|nr:branched-chain amino acid ABC transporter substrate-binding protein [Herbaspirillum sp. LeCh32-8]MBP0597092.1 branched-chain amino acid ABC transporter substrate-binding protein [Herbaspirillum sp. LeCh32-8]